MHRYVIALGAAVTLALAGCGFGPDQSREDAHDVTRVDKNPPDVITFNNKFSNVEHKCDGHGHRVYVTTQGYGFIVIVADPSCPGWVHEDSYGTGTAKPASYGTGKAS